MRKWSSPASVLFTAGLVVQSLVCGGCAGSGASTPAASARPPERAELPGADRVFTPQRRGDWCWAACCEMAFKYNGIDDITQEVLVEKYRGGEVDQTAIDGEIILALATEPDNRAARQPGAIPRSISLNTSGLTKAAIDSAKIYSSSDSAIEDFRHGHPLLLGLKDWEGAPAHIVFVSAIEFHDNYAAATDVGVLGGILNPIKNAADQVVGGYRYSVKSIEFYDPMPETGGLTTLTGAELDDHFRFYLSRKRARDVARNLSSTFQMR